MVEDEKRLAANVARALREGAGYAVDVADDGQEGLYLATSGLRSAGARPHAAEDGRAGAADALSRARAIRRRCWC